MRSISISGWQHLAHFMFIYSSAKQSLPLQLDMDTYAGSVAVFLSSSPSPSFGCTNPPALRTLLKAHFEKNAVRSKHSNDRASIHTAFLDHHAECSVNSLMLHYGRFLYNYNTFLPSHVILKSIVIDFFVCFQKLSFRDKTLG